MFTFLKSNGDISNNSKVTTNLPSAKGYVLFQSVERNFTFWDFLNSLQGI